MKTLEERSMAFMNCPWKFTAGCNFICETCLHSDSEGLKGLLDSIKRLSEQLEISEKKMKTDYEVWRVLLRCNRDTWTPYAVCTTREGAEQIFEILITHSRAREIRLEHIISTAVITTTVKTIYWKENEND